MVNRLLALLSYLGRATRSRFRFILMLAALIFGAVTEAGRPRVWRRTVRTEFRRALRQAVAGSLATTMVAASLIGVAIVYQALYWLAVAGQEQLVGSLLVTVLLRQVTPVLVGLLLLGRSGPVVVTELGAMRQGGQVAALQALGIDPFLLLVLPRVTASALAAYTLGVVFLLTALFTGFITGSVLGGVQLSLWSFLGDVLAAMRASDFIMFPVKMMLIGTVVAGTSCLTALTADRHEATQMLLPQGFVRGMLAVMIVSGVMSLVV